MSVLSSANAAMPSVRLTWECFDARLCLRTSSASRKSQLVFLLVVIVKMSSLRSPLSRGFVSRRRHILSSPVRRISSDAQKPQAENSAWSTKRLGTLFAAAGLGVGIAGYAAWTLTSRRIIALDAKPSSMSDHFFGGRTYSCVS